MFFSLQLAASLTSNMLIQALRVPSANLVTLRVCNLASTSQSTGNVGVQIVTMR